MTGARRPSPPPQLPGYTVGRLLGMGGFADVYLYTQHLPRRPVAVKVLPTDALDADVLTRFGTEADLMAQLSHHPSIVTIHHAAVAADGRPYLVMEYCARPGLGARYRTERIAVAEALRIGIRLASAVETAHRAGILHRDIKPANVLTTDFGWPALTDFGIAATTGWSGGGAVGMSIPWSPPELLAAVPDGDVRADVYSLAATVYSLVAGRSPFEVPGGLNGPADLVARIERMPLPATGRTDVPASLHSALARAMEKNPVHRFHSALALARALQAVEHELMLPGTPVELAEDGAEPALRAPGAGDGGGSRPGSGADDAATRLRPVVSIDPEGDLEARTGDRPGAGGASSARTAADEAATVTRRRPVTSISPEPADAPGSPAAGAAASGLPVFSSPGPAAIGTSIRTSIGTSIGTAVGDGVVEGAGDAARAGQTPRARRRARARRAATAAAAAVVLGAATGAAALARDAADDGGAADRAAASAAVPSRLPVVVTAVPSPADVRAVPQVDGTTVVSWTNPQPQDGDRYLWGVVEAAAVGPLTLVDGTEVTVGPGHAGRLCVEVSIVRSDRRASTVPAVGCTP